MRHTHGRILLVAIVLAWASFAEAGPAKKKSKKGKPSQELLDTRDEAARARKTAAEARQEADAAKRELEAQKAAEERRREDEAKDRAASEAAQKAAQQVAQEEIAKQQQQTEAAKSEAEAAKQKAEAAEKEKDASHAHAQKAEAEKKAVEDAAARAEEERRYVTGLYIRLGGGAEFFDATLFGSAARVFAPSFHGGVGFRLGWLRLGGEYQGGISVGTAVPANWHKALFNVEFVFGGRVAEFFVRGAAGYALVSAGGVLSHGGAAKAGIGLDFRIVRAFAIGIGADFDVLMQFAPGPIFPIGGSAFLRFTFFI